MARIASRDAWIGFAGGIMGAIVAGCLALVPWYFGPVEAHNSDKVIESGIAGLLDISEPEQQLRQIDRMEDLLRLDAAFHYEATLKTYRARAEAQISTRAAERTAAEAEQRRIAEEERQRAEALAAASEAEKARLEAEAETARQALEEEASRQAEQRRLEEEKAAQDRIETEQREASRRAAAALELERQLLEERVCRDFTCRSWIIR